MSYLKHNCYFFPCCFFFFFNLQSSSNFILINMDNNDRGKMPQFLKDSPKLNSLVFKWLHLNISFSVHFQTWAINQPYEHNGLCLQPFIIWIMSPVQVCINLRLKLELRLAEIFPLICTLRAAAPQDRLHAAQGREEHRQFSLSGDKEKAGEEKLEPHSPLQFTCTAKRSSMHVAHVSACTVLRKEKILKRSETEGCGAHRRASQSGKAVGS